MHLSADYWIDKTGGSDEVLKKQEEVRAFNSFAFANDPNMVDLAAYPAKQTSDEISKLIRSISKPYKQDLFYRDGGKIEHADYDLYTANLNLNELQDVVTVRFGMV